MFGGIVAGAMVVSSLLPVSAAENLNDETHFMSDERAGLLLLEVSINGAPTGYVANFHQDADRLYLPAAQFDGLGFRLDSASVRTAGTEARVYLDQVSGLSWIVNQAAQTIDITAPFAVLKPNRIRVAPRTPKVDSRADTGVVLSYSLYGEWGNGRRDAVYSRSLTGQYEARGFTPHFTATTTGYTTFVEDEKPRSVRFETRVDFDNPDKAWRLRLGDSYAAGPSWVQPVRFGGIQWRRDYSIRPDIVTMPTPQMDQNLSVPSTVDIFINGIQRYSQGANAGVLQLTDLPVVTGANTVRVVVTDQAGRRTEMNLPLYSSTELLAPGLTTFSLETGAQRQNYSVDSFNYGAGFFSGSLAYGLNDRMTLTGYSALAHAYITAGGGFAVSVGNAFLINNAVTFSRGPEGTGWSWYIGGERTSGNFSLAAHYQRSDSDYRDLSGRFGYTPVTERTVISAGLNMGRAGTTTLAYAYQKPLAQRGAGVISANHSVSVFRNQLHLNTMIYSDLRKDRAGEKRDWGAMILLAFPFGRQGSGYVDHSWREGQSADRVHVNGYALDQKLHWYVEGGNDPQREDSVQVEWRGKHVDLMLRAGEVENQRGGNLEIAQSFVIMGGQLSVAGRIDDGFALVDVEDSPGVSVALENHVIGRTNVRGRLFVPGLVSYAGNAISIDPLDLPVDASTGDTSVLVAPRAGAGLIARFAVRRERTAIVMVNLPDGREPPAGARVSLEGSDESYLLGYGGEIYLRGIREGENRLQLDWYGGHCDLSFTANVQAASLPRLGPYICTP
ncbi:fimbria/pilus outer membrane usher protein [Asticcacaulis machinosus]|uniref:Fimbria/pilus outer membrane usher protein n=1 Tax=Asticcacaulis machinosus TaxID=2984211 RepID=A0ABT5HMN4_9CAUL|nr:fimbria/pilus outer membrane usher protein [Asticcacaulis machinosus]MDC7677512.1 fimbria/pilus outer membrane usher protein [Asticcacaulis machinosus]